MNARGRSSSSQLPLLGGAALVFSVALWCKSAAKAAESAGDERTCKVETHNGLVFAPVRINGSGPHWFVLDTGASRMMLERKLARELKLPLEGSGKLGGAGTGQIPVEFARNVRLEIPGLVMLAVEFAPLI